METAVTFTPGGYVESMGGVGGVVWQPEIFTIPTHRGTRIMVEDGVSTINGVDVDCDVPVEIRNDHQAIAAFWAEQVKIWAASAAQLVTEMEAEARGELVIDGHAVKASGFTSAEQFMSFVDRAKTAQLRTSPGSVRGMVMVMNPKTDARYAVTRTSCSCQGHHGHGRCYHRALVLWLHDVQGVKVCRIRTIGVNVAGVPMTFGPKPAAEAA